jgi:DNA invertase Pin-like site-specific DNA recombinase
MRIGYARVSTQDQHLRAQTDALKQAGCEKIYTDQLSGASRERPGLTQALETLRQGDTLVVWKLDRLGRSLPHLVELISELKERGVGFKSLQENLDTTSGTGKLIFHLFASLAEFERDLIRERTLAGLAAARARGRKGGRPRVLEPKQVALVRAMYQDKNNSVKDICATLKVGKSTFYRYINAGKPAAAAPAATVVEGVERVEEPAKVAKAVKPTKGKAPSLAKSRRPSPAKPRS